MTAATRVFVLLLAWLLLPIGLTAEDTPPPPCSTPEFHQFDFWLGEWDLTWPDSGRGTNSVTALLDSCVIQENFSTTAETPFRGRSVSSYDSRAGKWQQTWVDNQGGYLEFNGEYADSMMILRRETIDNNGKAILQRMVWFNITDSSLDWSWERSDDGGRNWRVLWPIHYSRKQ